MDINFLRGSAEISKVSAIEVLPQSTSSLTTARLSVNEFSTRNMLPTEEVKAYLAAHPSPNPGDKVTISMNNFDKDEEVVLVLYNVQAIQTKTVVTDDNGAINTNMAFVNKLSQGVYIIIANSKTNKISIRLLVK